MLGIARQMAQKMAEERFEAHEKELTVLRDLVVATCKNVERMSEDLQVLRKNGTKVSRC